MYHIDQNIRAGDDLPARQAEGVSSDINAINSRTHDHVAFPICCREGVTGVTVVIVPRRERSCCARGTNGSEVVGVTGDIRMGESCQRIGHKHGGIVCVGLAASSWDQGSWTGWNGNVAHHVITGGIHSSNARV